MAHRKAAGATSEPTASSVEEIKERALPILRQFRVARAGIYGSRARGDHRPDSDLDFVIEPQKRFLSGISPAFQLALSDALGLEAHVATHSTASSRGDPRWQRVIEELVMHLVQAAGARSGPGLEADSAL